MRKLASIQKVVNIEPIDGADRIDKATILGWECVIKKNEFNINDLCVYFEIDSILPKHEIFSFLESDKYRIRTRKFRKQIAQGLAMPLTILSNFTDKTNWKEGDDVTNIIGVKKHDPYLEKERKQSSNKKSRNVFIEYMKQYAWFRKIWYDLGLKRPTNFPTEYISKTDETRVQNIPNVGKIYNGLDFYYSEKLDGQSGTYFYFHKKHKLFQPRFNVCSRNLQLFNDDNSNWWQVAKKFDIENKLKSIKANIGIQVEIIGPGIQGNKYNLKELDFYIFNVYDIDNKRYYNLEEKKIFCYNYDFKLVPFVGFIPINDSLNSKFFVELADGKSVLNNKIWREGLVFRCINDDNISFKAISNKFLLKYKDE